METLTLELGSDILYVAGHINGVATVFNQDSLNRSLWKANVDAAEDSIYRISLEMYDEAGNRGTYEDTVEYILPVFVYDRTQEDVDRVYELRAIGWDNLTDAQRSEWLSGLKGCLNLSDLKRIENAIYVVAQLLELDLQTNKDNLPMIPNTLYFQQMLDNMSVLRAEGFLYVDTPQVPEQPLNTFGKVNDVERILHDIYMIYNANNSSFHFAGSEIYTGEETGLLM